MDLRNASSPLLGKADSNRANGNSISHKSGKSGKSGESGRSDLLSYGKSVDSAAANGAAINGAAINGAAFNGAAVFNGANLNECIVDAFPCVGVGGSRGREEMEEEEEEEEEDEEENKPVGSLSKEPI